MAIRFTTLTLKHRLDDARRWSEEERRAAIKALQGSVNRAYDRAVESGMKSFAIKAIEKDGKIATWTSLKTMSYSEQMAEIRRGMKLLGMSTLTKSGYRAYISDVTNRLGQARKVGAADDTVLYDSLSESEKKAYWDLYYSILRSPGAANRISKGKLDSERLQRMVWHLQQRGDLTDEEIVDLLTRSFNAQEELDAEAERLTQTGVSLDPADLLR